MNTKKQQTNSQIFYYFSYDTGYEEIYESSYGANFIFVDEDEEAPDFDSPASENYEPYQA